MVLNNVSKKRNESPIYKTLRMDIENYNFPTFGIKPPGYSKPHATSDENSRGNKNRCK